MVWMCRASVDGVPNRPAEEWSFHGGAVDNQEVIMNCIRCGGLQMLDQFYGMEGDGSVWMYDGVRCLNCGSIIAPMRETSEPIPSLRTERINQYGLTVRTVAGR